MRMKNPIFYQDSLFVVRGYDVLVYSVNDHLLTLEDTFPFPDPVESLKFIESVPAGLIVTTSLSWWLIAGGPQIVSYYVATLAERTPGAQLSEAVFGKMLSYEKD